MGPTTPASNSRHPVQTPTYRLRLNDYMQQWRRRDKVKWVVSASGRQERPQWTVTCYLNDIRYGTGRSLTKSDAKELAAKETLEIIYRQNAPNYGVESYKWPVEGGGDHHHYGYGYPIAASTSAYAPVSHPYIATPGTPAAGLQPLPTTSASPSHYAYPSQYPTYQYQPYYHTQHAPQQQTYYVYSTSDPYYRH